MGKTKGALRDTRLNELVQARFVKRQVTTLNPFDSGGVDIHAGDLVPNLREHCRLHQPYVAAAEDTDSQCLSP
jgi:hypothetical protein